MKRLAQILGWVAGTALLIYFLRQFDRQQLSDVARTLRWGWIAAALIANALILGAWAGLWWTATPRGEHVKYSLMFQINAIASALMNTVPFLGGHAAAVVLMVKRGGMSRQGALSVMALDQLGEGLAKVTIFGFVAVVAPIPQWMRFGIATACIAVGSLLVVLIASAHSHAWIRPSGSAAPSLISRARKFVAEWAERLETLRDARLSATALLFAIGTKVAEGVGIFAVQHALGVDISIGGTALVLAAILLGSFLPLAPGNAGIYEAGAFLAYRHLGIEPGLASILAVLAHVCFWLPAVGVGYIIGSWTSFSAVTLQDPTTDR